MAFGTSDFGFSKPAPPKGKKRKRNKPKPRPRTKKKNKTPWWAVGGSGLLPNSPWGGGKAERPETKRRRELREAREEREAKELAANRKAAQARWNRMRGINDAGGVGNKPYGPAVPKPKTKKRSKTTSSGSSGGGGGSSSGSAPSTGGTTGTDSKYSKPVAQVELDWEKMYAPARKQIDNMRAEVARRRKVDEDNWAAYKTWAEGMATKTSDALAANNKATNESVTANNAAAIESINKYVDQARASMGSSGSLGTATGAGSMSADAAAAAASGGVDAQLIGDAQTSYNTIADAVNAQNQYNVSMAKQAYDQTHNQALFDIDTKSSEIDQAIAAAKLDKFYKDRQYNLDLEAAEWLRGYKDRSLNASIDQANQSAALTRLGLDVKAANTVQQDNADAQQIRANAFKDVQSKKTGDGELAKFGELPTYEQGQLMLKTATDLLYKYKQGLSNVAMIEIMSQTFGDRFNNSKSAKEDLAELLKQFNLGVPGGNNWPGGSIAAGGE